MPLVLSYSQRTRPTLPLLRPAKLCRERRQRLQPLRDPVGVERDGAGTSSRPRRYAGLTTTRKSRLKPAKPILRWVATGCQVERVDRHKEGPGDEPGEPVTGSGRSRS